MGRELQKSYGQEPQVVMTFPLLPGLDGKEKMSKSLDNYIGLNDTPFEKFEKSMKIPDELLKQYFELTTDLPQDRIEEILEGDIREAHRLFARELIKMYDKEEDSQIAKNKYEQIAKGEIPDNMPEIVLKEEKMPICDLLIKVGFAPSKGEARRRIAGSWIKINGNLIKDSNEIIEIANGKVVQFGKNKFIRLVKKQ